MLETQVERHSVYRTSHVLVVIAHLEMKIHVLGILVVLLNSCLSSNSSQIIGTYRTKGGIEWGAKMKLNNDSSFSFITQGGLLFYETTGKWKVKNRYIIFNSDLQPNEFKPHEILECVQTQNNYIAINLVRDDSSSYPGLSVAGYFNGKFSEGKISDNRGRIQLNNLLIDSIVIAGVGIPKIELNVHECNYFKIAPGSAPPHGYEFFTNEKWKIKAGKLIDLENNGQSFMKIKQEKINVL